MTKKSKTTKGIRSSAVESVGGITYFSPFQNEYGVNTKRTPQTHPYSFDGYVTYRNGTNEEVNGTVYSDRLQQWDYQKTENLKQKHFGNKGDYYDNRTPEQIEAFLSEYFEKPVKIIFIMKYCNFSSGYPTWRFDYKHV